MNEGLKSSKCYLGLPLLFLGFNRMKSLIAKGFTSVLLYFDWQIMPASANFACPMYV